MAAGTGLTGGGTSGDVTLSIAAGGVGTTQINNTQVQSRVTGTCTAGSSISTVNPDGTVLCEPDDVGATAYTAGIGIDIIDTTIGIKNSGVGPTQIATNAIDETKVANGSLRIADLAIWTLTGNIGGATISTGCSYWNFGPPKGGLTSDLILVQSSTSVPGGSMLSAYFNDNVSGGVCNFNTVSIILPNPFVLTIYGIR